MVRICSNPSLPLASLPQGALLKGGHQLQSAPQPEASGQGSRRVFRFAQQVSGDTPEAQLPVEGQAIALMAAPAAANQIRLPDADAADDVLQPGDA